MPKIGPTGKFPEGKFNEHDEGEIAIAVYPKKGNIIIDFNSPVHWIGMPPEQAVQLAETILKHVKKMAVEEP